MVNRIRLPDPVKPPECPRCGRPFLAWDEDDQQFICGDCTRVVAPPLKLAGLPFCGDVKADRRVFVIR